MLSCVAGDTVGAFNDILMHGKTRSSKRLRDAHGDIHAHALD